MVKLTVKDNGKVTVNLCKSVHSPKIEDTLQASAVAQTECIIMVHLQ